MATQYLPLDPSVMKPSGQEFVFWENQTNWSRTYHVDGSSPRASDQNSGTQGRPFRTISRAAEVLQPGQRVIVHAGIYRECVRPARGGLSASQMIGYQAEGEVIVKGTQPVGPNWKQQGAGIWALDLSAIDFGDYNPFDLENLPPASFDIMDWAKPIRGTPPYTLCRGMVFQDGRRLARVASPEELRKTEGAYWTDRAAGRLLVRAHGNKDPNAILMEITTRRSCLRPKLRGLSYIEVRGFTFEQVGNGFPRPQEGAVSVAGGDHWLIEQNTIRQVNGIGLDIGGGWYGGAAKPPEPVDPSKADGKETPGWTIVQGNHIHDTGVCGIAGLPARNCLIEDNLLERNTLYPVEKMYECAGIKTHHNQGTLIRRNLIVDQTVNGIWMDWDNRDSRCTQNVMVRCKTGVYLEASVVEPYCQIDRNIIVGGDQGIYEHDNKCQTYERNLIIKSLKGIVLRGKWSTRIIDKKHPAAGGENTLAGNVFVQVPKPIEEQAAARPGSNTISGNTMVDDTVEVSLDIPSRKLKLRVPRQRLSAIKALIAGQDGRIELEPE